MIVFKVGVFNEEVFNRQGNRYEYLLSQEPEESYDEVVLTSSQFRRIISYLRAQQLWDNNITDNELLSTELTVLQAEHGISRNGALSLLFDQTSYTEIYD